MDKLLYDGIPLEDDYLMLLKSDSFKSMEKFSDAFLAKHVSHQTRKWVKDPLHQWSRQWEYPYVYNKIKKISEKSGEIEVLDAGSGITFFPYYLDDALSGLNIFCCDYDASLEGAFAKINLQENKDIRFSQGDLRSLSYKEESFDVIYCISVLEHTNEYECIIDEFHRLLKPGGSLIITFDVSLDGTRDIAVDEGVRLLEALINRFPCDSGFSLNLSSKALDADVLTTLKAGKIDSSLLPWKLPSFIYQLKSLVSSGRYVSWPPPLTVFCLSLEKQ